MHWVGVEIIDDSSSTSSDDEAFEFGNNSQFHESKSIHNHWEKYVDDANPSEVRAMESVKRAEEHFQKAAREISLLDTLVRELRGGNYGLSPVASGAAGASDCSAALARRRCEYERSGAFLSDSVRELRSGISKTRRYYRELAEISKKFPLGLRENESGAEEIYIQNSLQTKNCIILQMNDDFTLRWSLSDNSYFSFNSKSISHNINSNFVHCFFDLVCHEMFERIKNDRTNASIQYSAENNSRYIYFNIFNDITWIFELGEQKESGNPHICIFFLVRLITDSYGHPTDHIKDNFLLQKTFSNLSVIITKYFSGNDFCEINFNFQKGEIAFEISSKYMKFPFVIYANKDIIALTETINEMSFSTHQTEGYISSNSFEEWSKKFSTSLFLLMVERVSLSFGYVFRNKGKSGTIIIGQKKIKFVPTPESQDVSIVITNKTTFPIKWSQIPGTNHITRLCVLFFADLSTLAPE